MVLMMLTVHFTTAQFLSAFGLFLIKSDKLFWNYSWMWGGSGLPLNFQSPDLVCRSNEILHVNKIFDLKQQTNNQKALFFSTFPVLVIKTNPFWGFLFHVFSVWLFLIFSLLSSLVPCLFDINEVQFWFFLFYFFKCFILYVRQLLHILSELLLWSTFVILETLCLKLSSFEVADARLF